jgi:hypothetical protein
VPLLRTPYAAAAHSWLRAACCSMIWPQCFDGGFSAPLASLFGVSAIPQTFTIDADGAPQDRHIDNASI